MDENSRWKYLRTEIYVVRKFTGRRVRGEKKLRGEKFGIRKILGIRIRDENDLQGD